VVGSALRGGERIYTRFLLFHDSGGKGKIEEKAGWLAIPKLAETLRIGFRQTF